MTEERYEERHITRFLDLAEHYSTWSKDPSTKVGAVAVKNGVPIVGYNGFPKGIKDAQERLDDRETKYRLTIHAEMNTIYNAANLGISLEGASLFVYGLPVCESCSLGVIQSGIHRVYMRVNPDRLSEKWLDSFQRTAENFWEAGIDFGVESINKTIHWGTAINNVREFWI